MPAHSPATAPTARQSLTSPAQPGRGELFPEKLEVQCPLHDSKFSFVDGTPHQPPADKPVETYAVKVEGDGVVKLGERTSIVIAIERSDAGSSPRNPLGLKGIGEGGAISPPAAIANAVEDALAPFGVRVTRTPLGPSVVLGLLEQAAARKARPA